MKKTRLISIIVLALFMLSSLSCFAAYDTATYPFFSEGVGQIIAKNNTPTIDGSISAAEGWSDAKAINSTNMAPFWSSQSMCIVSGNLYFAWDAKNLYVAADITDESTVLSTGEDDVNPDSNGSNVYGWNGDVFIFSIDPLGECFKAGMVGANDRTPWYCIGIGENNTFKCYLSNSGSSDGDITSDIDGAAASTNTGWAFECSIPWDLIINDTMNVSLGDVQLEVDDITVAGAISKVGISYMDRAVASEKYAQFNQGANAVEDGAVFTISRNVTVPTTLPDGTSGVNNGGQAPRSYGIDLTIGDASGFAPETTTADTTAEDTTEAPETTKSTEKKETKADNKTDENKSDDKGTNTGLIIGIVVAVAVVAAIVVFFVIKKKRSAVETIEEFEEDKKD